MQKPELTFADRALFAKIADFMVEGFILCSSKPFEEQEPLAEIIPHMNNPQVDIAATFAELIPRWERFKDAPEEALNEMASAELAGSIALLAAGVTPTGLSGTQKKLLIMLRERLQMALLVEEAAMNLDNFN